MNVATKTTGTAVAKKPETPGQLVAPSELQARLLADAGIGSQDMGKDDKVTPFLGLVQGLSPQLDENKPQYLEAAKIGSIFNSVTGEVFLGSEGVRVIPILFKKVYNAWIPRDLGGGFLGSYADPELQVAIFVPPTQNQDSDQPVQIVETANWIVLAEGKDGSWSPAIIPMKSTQLKASRKWGTLRTILENKYGNPAPIFTFIYTITSVSETNEKGTFANYKITNDVKSPTFVTAELYDMAKSFRAFYESAEGTAATAAATAKAADTVTDAEVVEEDKNAKY